MLVELQVGIFSKREGPATQPQIQLQKNVPEILHSVSRQLRDKSVKTKGGIFRVLKELVSVQPDATASDISQLVPGIIAALEARPG